MIWVMVLLLLMLVPLIGALFLLLTRDKSLKLPTIFSLLVFILGIFLLKDVFTGDVLTYNISIFKPFPFVLHADILSAIFVVLSSFLWFVVSIYSPRYMEYEGKKLMFGILTLVTLFSVLGIFLAGNLLTMLLFFELMTVSSYFWVIHRWDKAAIKAGYFYLFFSIAGGLLVALGIALMGSATSVSVRVGMGRIIPSNPKLFSWSITALLVGFGIKAGMVPLHLWLPHAHSVAPTPGSALLSGLVIKVGAYGLIRVGELAGFGTELGAGVSSLASIVIVLGTLTMLLGVLSALIQSDGKKLLAYHSISQMGYIILGLGVALYLGRDGGLGLSGSIYHIINHALFKVALFLGVGIIYINTGETDLYKLGGLWRKFPATAVFMFIAVLGITGAPGLNGYASKSLIHHGISLAVEEGGSWLVWIERLFMLVGIGTAASFSKLFYLIFLGEKTELEVEGEKSFSLQLPLAILSIVMLVVGIKPNLLLDFSIGPAVKSLGIVNIFTSLEGVSFWNFKDILDMLITLALGVFVCWAGFKSGAFSWQPPFWLSIEGIAMWLGENSKGLRIRVLESYHRVIGNIKNLVKSINSNLYSRFRKFDSSKSASILRITLEGISADIGILILLLLVLLGLLIFTNPILL